MQPIALHLAFIVVGLSTVAFGCSQDAETEAVPLCEQLNACACAAEQCTPPELAWSEEAVVAPSPDLPPEAVSQAAHNNLDIAWFDGRLFFAYRTAPSHFASADTWLYVVSTADHRRWRFEGAFNEGADLREPRFLTMHGMLHLYYARLGADRFAFEPGVARRASYEGPGSWTEPIDVFEPGFIPWRFKYREQSAYLLGYTGGGSIYSDAPSDVRVHWLRSDDGLDWAPVVPDQPVVLQGGVSETDFVFTESGGIVALGRNEAGDAGGFGSRICRAAPSTLGTWTCRDDPRKFDSPLLFRHAGQTYLIGRRNLTADGHYDVATEGELPQRRLVNQAEYWQTPKRCAVWTIDDESLEVEHALDLPSGGDTCFASLIAVGADQVLVYDYRSSGAERDQGWLDGQTAPTEIYRVTLTLPQR